MLRKYDKILEFIEEMLSEPRFTEDRNYPSSYFEIEKCLNGRREVDQPEIPFHIIDEEAISQVQSKPVATVPNISLEVKESLDEQETSEENSLGKKIQPVLPFYENQPQNDQYFNEEYLIDSQTPKNSLDVERKLPQPSAPVETSIQILADQVREAKSETEKLGYEEQRTEDKSEEETQSFERSAPGSENLPDNVTLPGEQKIAGFAVLSDDKNVSVPYVQQSNAVDTAILPIASPVQENKRLLPVIGNNTDEIPASLLEAKHKNEIASLSVQEITSNQTSDLLAQEISINENKTVTLPVEKVNPIESEASTIEVINSNETASLSINSNEINLNKTEEYAVQEMNVSSEALPLTYLNETSTQYLQDINLNETAALSVQELNQNETAALPVKEMNQKETAALPVQEMYQNETAPLPVKEMNQKETEALPVQELSKQETLALHVQEINQNETTTELPVQEMNQRATATLAVQEMNPSDTTALPIQGMDQQNEIVPIVQEMNLNETAALPVQEVVLNETVKLSKYKESPNVTSDLFVQLNNQFNAAELPDQQNFTNAAELPIQQSNETTLKELSSQQNQQINKNEDASKDKAQTLAASTKSHSIVKREAFKGLFDVAQTIAGDNVNSNYLKILLRDTEEMKQLKNKLFRVVRMLMTSSFKVGIQHPEDIILKAINTLEY